EDTEGEEDILPPPLPAAVDPPGPPTPIDLLGRATIAVVVWGEGGDGSDDTGLELLAHEVTIVDVDSGDVLAEMSTGPDARLAQVASLPYGRQIRAEVRGISPAGPGEWATTGTVRLGFTDVGVDHPFVDDVIWAADGGVTTGYDDGTFRPTDAVSRQAMAAFLWRIAGQPAPTSAADFTDVDAHHPFADAIAWLAEEGVTTGYDDGTFRPTDAVSRQAMAAFLWRIAGQPTPTTAADFTDVDADHPFAEPIAWLAEEGITTGYDDGTFRPTDPVSRQAMVAFLHRQATS
ncbi:MAG: S-layer homology domain-containing protein, partial [Acidimicrobiia bacterium]|nr:S-layer homology domain-containing protein [Acidimicrobiia bacterium]